MLKVLNIKSIVLFFYIASFSIIEANHTSKVIVEMDAFIQGRESSSGVRIVSPYRASTSSFVNYSHILAVDFKKVFSQQNNEHIILSNYPLYAFPQFVAYARTLGGYNDFMLSLDTKIMNDKTFRKSTVCILGFEYSFGLFHETSGFHDFVRNEALTIKDMQERFASKVKECEDLITVYTAKKELCFDSGMQERLAQRINALEQTRTQQNISLPSAIDNQLHKELLEISYVINRLERNFPNNHYLQTIAPVISRYAEQAKIVQSLAKAFELSDFCYTVTQVLTQGVTAIGKGVYKTAQTFVTPQHWRDMATGAVELGMVCIATLGEQEGLRYRMMLAFMSQDPDAQERVAQYYCAQTQAQKDAINLCVQQTYEKIKAMPWQEVVESGAEIGTSMILDTLALHALSGFTRAASGSLVKQLSGALESGVIFTEQYAVEVAGFGKLIVQEGPEVAKKVIDIAIHNPELFVDKMLLDTAINTTLKSESIPLGAIYKDFLEISPEIMPKHNLKHHFLGEIVTKRGDIRLQGFHHARNYPERIKEIIIPRNKFGIYHAKYEYMGLAKESTFFPDHWNRVTVLKKISEAYKNPIKFSNNGITGVTSEGIEIEIWFKHNKLTNEIIINSAYPTKSQLLNK